MVPVAAFGNEGVEDGAPMQKESCVDAGELDIIRDGMMLVYGNKEEEAAGWFTDKCKNATVGAHSDMCTCFYWAYRAHMVQPPPTPICPHSGARCVETADASPLATGSQRYRCGRGSPRWCSQHCGELTCWSCLCSYARSKRRRHKHSHPSQEEKTQTLTRIVAHYTHTHEHSMC